jgi:DNA-binding Xre family transcriptional regulator
MSRTELRLKAGFSTKVLAKLGKNESVSVDVLVKICAALNCEITDIMDIIEITEENK